MAQGDLSLSDYSRILRRRSWEIVATIVLFLSGTSLYIQRQVPEYQAQAKIKMARPDAAGALFGGPGYYQQNSLETEARVIESSLIARRVAERLAKAQGIDDPDGIQALTDQAQGSIGAGPIMGTDILQITARGTDRQFVAELANTTAEVYIESNLEEKNKQARKVREFIESQLDQTAKRLTGSEEEMRQLREGGRAVGLGVALENRITDVRMKLADLEPKLTDRHPDVLRLKQQLAPLEEQLRNLPSGEVDYSRAQRDLEVNEKTYRTLREKLEEARLVEAEKTADVYIIERARLPGAPLASRQTLSLAMGGVLGFVVACVMAFLFEALDTSIGTIEDIEQLLQVPVLAVIPHIGRIDEPLPKPGKKRQWLSWVFQKKQVPDQMRLPLYVHYYPNSIAAEAFKILRTNMKLSPTCKVILVTSAGPGEGKTTMLTNLAIVIAQSGARTVLVSADLRKPELDRVFGLERDVGLTEVLQGTVPLSQALRGLSDFILGKFGFEETIKHPHLANLFLITSGHMSENPVELIGSKATEQLLEELKGRFDVVLVDAPPILPIADSLLLAPKTDGVMLVYQVGRISRAALQRAKTQLESAGARILGVVLNHVRPEVQTKPTYYYRERYAYGTEEKEATAPEPPRA